MRSFFSADIKSLLSLSIRSFTTFHGLSFDSVLLQVSRRRADMANWPPSTSDPRLPGVSLLTVYSESDRHPSRTKSPLQLPPSSGLSPPYFCEDGMSDREHIENQ